MPSKSNEESISIKWTKCKIREKIYKIYNDDKPFA